MPSTILQEPWSRGLSVLVRIEEVLVRQTTPHQDLLIGRSAHYGTCLFLDDLMQSAASDEALYHEAFVHPAMLLHAAPRRVLIGGAGEGATAREVLRHGSVREVVAVDLDAAVVQACREHLPSWSAGAFDDPRLQLRIEPIQDTLAQAPSGSFDVILLDVTDPVVAGPSVELFSARFFGEVARVLADDGVVVLQSGAFDVMNTRLLRSVCATLGTAFPWVQPMLLNVPSFHSLWTATLARKQPGPPRPVDLTARVAALRGLRFYDEVVHRGLLHLPRFAAEALAQPGTVISGDDDRRLIAFGVER